MNILFGLFEIIIVSLVLLLFYRVFRKDGLFIFIGFMAILLGIMMFKLYDFALFPINYGLPFIMGIFIASNIIIQRYGIDEVKKIICYFIFPYVSALLVICLGSLILFSEYNSISSLAYDNLYGYNLGNFRCFIGGCLSIGFMLYLNGEVYYYIRRSKNMVILSNLGSILIVQFIESIIFVFIAYLGMVDFLVIFGMIIVRYLLKIVIGLIILSTTYVLVSKRGRKV